MSLTSALMLAGRSLGVYSIGIEVAGHNIANASTPGYIRDELQLASNPPYRHGSLLIGTGVMATGIRQQIDAYLESRIYVANSDSQAAQARDAIYKQLEIALQELGENDLSTSFNGLLSAIHDVVNQPESGALRQIAVQEGQRFASTITSLRLRVDELRSAQTTQVQHLVEESNRLIDEVNSLNRKIIQAEAAGIVPSDAGALRTQRLTALNRLSEIVPIRVIERPSGEVDVFSGSDFLVMSGHVQHLEVENSVDRNVLVSMVRLSQTGAPLSAGGGELRGTVDARDLVLGGFVDQLNQYAGALISEFNKIHSTGEGLKGFTSITGTNRVEQATAPLNLAGLPFAPRHGSFDLKIVNLATGISETASIGIDLDGIGADTSLEDLRAAIDGLDNVSASITSEGRLKITTASGYEVRFGNDSSGVLAGLGMNAFFTGSDSGNIAVNSLLVADASYLAVSRGGGPGDGSNAVRLAQLVDVPIASLGNMSLDEHYNSTISRLAQSSAAESALARGLEGFHDALWSQREQRSGVSLDEEALKLMEFQRGYQAAARIISTVDELMSVLMAL